MKSKNCFFGLILVLFLVFLVSGCGAHYNTQKGAAIGAGVGAIAGQAIGRNTESTLIGAGVGSFLGSIFGNALDQEKQIRSSRPAYTGRSPAINPSEATRQGYAVGQQSGKEEAVRSNYKWGQQKGYEETYDYYTSPEYRQETLE